VARQIKTGDDLKSLVEEAIKSKVNLEPAKQSQKLEGPAKVQEAPTTKTTTSPTGTSATTTTQTTYNVTYNTNSFSWTTTTNITNPDGSSETKDETPVEPKSECELHPETVSCQEPDTPDGPEKPTKDVQVVVTPDGGWGADGGSCPAPVSTTVQGMPVVVDNTLFCQFLGGIRFAVIGAFGIAAALIFMGAFKGN